MNIRIMTIEDFDLMFSLWKEAGLVVPDLETEKEKTKTTIKFNPNSNFVALENGEIIGTILGTFNGNRGWIYHLAVDPIFQRKGIGTAILHKTEHVLKTKGAKKVLLGVDKLNLKVVPFYEKNGYKEISDAIYMVKNL